MVPYHKDTVPLERLANLHALRSGRAKILVCTDLAARCVVCVTLIIVIVACFVCGSERESCAHDLEQFVSLESVELHENTC